MDLSQLFIATLHAPYVQLKENAASYYAERRGETLYLFFEKSNGATDWKNNLDFPAKPYREMCGLWFAHRGFLRVFKTIEPHIAPLVMDEGVRRIVISGYSHGAALALLAHEYCVFHRPELKSAVQGFGFGCPRVVWGFAGRGVKARFRGFTVVKNCRDLITRLPPWLFGYRHVGNILHIGRDLRLGGVNSHRAERYLEALDGRTV